MACRLRLITKIYENRLCEVRREYKSGIHSASINSIDISIFQNYLLKLVPRSDVACAGNRMGQFR